MNDKVTYHLELNFNELLELKRCIEAAQADYKEELFKFARLSDRTGIEITLQFIGESTSVLEKIEDLLEDESDG